MLVIQLRKLYKAVKRMSSSPLTETVAARFFELNRLIHVNIAKLTEAQKEFKLPYSHLQILALIDKMGPLTISEISRYFSIAKPNVTPMIDKLCECEYAERVRDTRDRRVVHVALTGIGTQILHKLENQVGEHLYRLNGIGNEFGFENMNREMGTLLEVLTKAQ